MTTPVVVVATFTPNEGELDRVQLALNIAIEQVHTEPGCLLYALHEREDGKLVLIEKWQSAQHLATHGQGAAVQDLNESLSALLTQPSDVVTMTPTPAGTDSQGSL